MADLRQKKITLTPELKATMAQNVEAHKAQHTKPATTCNCSLSLDDMIQAASEKENGAAYVFNLLMRNRFVCVRSGPRMEWFTYCDGVWRKDVLDEPMRQFDAVRDEFLKFADAVQEQIADAVRGGERDKQTRLTTTRDQLVRAATALNGWAYRKKALEASASGEGWLVRDGAIWDTPAYTLPCKNGIVNLRKLEKGNHFRKAEPEDYVCSTTNVEYNPNATCPIWESFLLSTFDEDKGLIHHLQKIIGYSVCHDPKEHKLFIFYGRGRNGKSVFMETIQNILGKLTATIEQGLFLDSGRKKQAGGASPEKLQLRGKGLCVCSELNAQSRLDVANVKNLTGGDTIAARALYSPHVEEFKPSHTLVLLTNHLPKASSDEYAFWKRVQAIPFKLSFVDNPQAEHERHIDKDLPAKLENEYSGILNWIIQGAAAWQKEGLGEMPASVESATKEYQRSEDILQDFLDECCTEQRVPRIRTGGGWP